MAEAGQVRPSSAAELDSDKGHIEKKPRIEVEDGVRDGLDENVDASALTPIERILDVAKTSKKASKRSQRRKKGKHALPEPYSTEDVLWHDVLALLGSETANKIIEDDSEWDSPFAFREEVEVVVSALSSSGDALALAPAPHPPWVVVAPFALPGEKIRVRVYRSARLHSFADLLSVVTPNPDLRDPARVRCRYFGSCAGCQYQMLSYETQLDLKRTVVVKAYQNFSGLPEASIPPIGQTIPSPLQYGYRTKITPHFEAPPKKFQKAASSSAGNLSEPKPDWLKIGFNQIGKRHVMDIEECPIATPVLNEALGPMRQNIAKNIYNYKRGVSLLLRDSVEITRPEKPPSDTAIADPTMESIDALSSSLEKHVCITDHKAIVRDRVGDMLFDYPGGSFFQNNNSVLVPLTNYVRDAIFPPTATPKTAANPIGTPAPRPHPTHLVDAYCGSGLFAITLSPYFTTVTGIELSSDSIKFATHNAQLNALPPGKCTFRAGDAANIFATVSSFPATQTVLVIDPPRKGCDERFLEQLVGFRCALVVYVSCNVHTQARDVGAILRRSAEVAGGGAGGSGGRYVLESLRGCDLFPQTAHVESVAVLRLV